MGIWFYMVFVLLGAAEPEGECEIEGTFDGGPNCDDLDTRVLDKVVESAAVNPSKLLKLDKIIMA